MTVAPRRCLLGWIKLTIVTLLEPLPRVDAGSIPSARVIEDHARKERCYGNQEVQALAESSVC
jgi:hypothetical protein